MCNLTFMLHHQVEVIHLCVSYTFHPAPRGSGHLLVYYLSFILHHVVEGHLLARVIHVSSCTTWSRSATCA